MERSWSHKACRCLWSGPFNLWRQSIPLSHSVRASQPRTGHSRRLKPFLANQTQLSGDMYQENKTLRTTPQGVWTWNAYPLKVVGSRDLLFYTRGRHPGLQKVASFWVIAVKKVNKRWLKSTSRFNASSRCPCLTSRGFLPGADCEEFHLGFWDSFPGVREQDIRKSRRLETGKTTHWKSPRTGRKQ